MIIVTSQVGVLVGKFTDNDFNKNKVINFISALALICLEIVLFAKMFEDYEQVASETPVVDIIKESPLPTVVQQPVCQSCLSRGLKSSPDDFLMPKMNQTISRATKSPRSEQMEIMMTSEFRKDFKDIS